LAKVYRPLFADVATGRIGCVVSFKKGAVWNSIVPQFHRSPWISATQEAQRNKFSAACVAWGILSAEEKQAYVDAAPNNRTGFQFFLSQELVG